MPPEDAREKHVFVSYVHENSDEVDKLCGVLDAVNIPYCTQWRRSCGTFHVVCPPPWPRPA